MRFISFVSVSLALVGAAFAAPLAEGNPSELDARRLLALPENFHILNGRGRPTPPDPHMILPRVKLPSTDHMFHDTREDLHMKFDRRELGKGHMIVNSRNSGKDHMIVNSKREYSGKGHHVSSMDTLWRVLRLKKVFPRQMLPHRDVEHMRHDRREDNPDQMINNEKREAFGENLHMMGDKRESFGEGHRLLDDRAKLPFTDHMFSDAHE
ncbi:hypothetical protein C8R44DRAFT_875309 [Mycena epipterygia]|nr:hypothetical protein C8R44DRAFT_875309 [Mycena epipterygia]